MNYNNNYQSLNNARVRRKYTWKISQLILIISYNFKIGSLDFFSDMSEQFFLSHYIVEYSQKPEHEASAH